MPELEFGLSVPVSAAAGSDPVRLALRAEQAGFDFLSASDHPALADPVYETWTMLSWILAATSRIRVATRVLGVPFRSPALVAKMAETQARLSGGRFILGLGAGAADPELRAYGLPVPTPAEKIAGLSDAIAIARGLWAEPAFTHAGPRYHTDSAALAPKPDSPIPIWLGTFGPRALALTGRQADGWIPSYGYAPPSRIPDLRRHIDAAAAEAGRSPADIAFIYHLTIAVGAPDTTADLTGSPTELAEHLATLARTLHCTAFSLAITGPDPDQQLNLLATQVLPQTRTHLP
jgi:alkanesulfonate monooxygenase SsuD/methylene tetrahydromethanopterin reductase-like flavin-dependent oxidoreductase (luciferase family)